MSKSSRAVVALGVLTLIVCLILVTDFVPWLRGEVPWLPGSAAWVWGYDLPRWVWVLPCILGVAIYTVGAAALLQENDENNRYPVRLILWSFVGAALLSILLMTMEERPLFLLFTRSASLLTGGYQHSATLITDLNTTLRDWPQFMIDYREEFKLGSTPTSPPGWTALYYAVAHGFGTVPPVAQTFSALVRPLECLNLSMMTWTDGEMASAWFQMFMPLWSALAVAPLYKLGVSIFNRRVALWAVVLWPIIPGLAMFNPRFNTFYVLLTLVLLVILWRGLDRDRGWWIALAGFIVSVATFLNISLFPLGLLVGLTIIGFFVTQRQGVPFLSLVRQLAIFGVGCAVVWIIYGGLSGVSVLDVVRIGLQQHVEQHNRPYFPWLFMHPYDMFFFVGIPVAALAIWGLVQHTVAFRQWRSASRANVFVVAGGLTLILLILSGTAKGETGRLWLFFAPIWLLLSGEVLQRFTNRQRLAILAMQAITLFCMAAVLRVNFTTLTVPPTPSLAATAPTLAINKQFAHGSDVVTLVGVDATPDSDAIKLSLHWRADSYVSRPYYLSVVPVAPDQSLRKGYDWDPLDWHYPPSCWMPGQEFIDTVTVKLSDPGVQVQSGNWWFSLSISDVFTHEAMLVGGQNTQIGIGPVSIPAGR
ncbi:MAG: hypothetical protein ABI947_17825 [Chloroflexota bacterium]